MFRVSPKQSEVSTVSVAGSFNSWNPRDQNYQMKKISSNKYELKMPTDKLEVGKTYTFKFVLNNEQWLSPPNFAKNVILEGEHANLTLKY